jgi:tetratricopeptide (TPR) repeat protein
MHPLTLMSVSNIAGMLQDKGEYEKAEEINWRALEGFEKVPGLEYPDTVTIIDSLASVLLKQGKYELAIQMYRRAVDWKEKALGAEHPDILTDVYGLAYLLQSQKKYDNVSVPVHPAMPSFTNGATPLTNNLPLLSGARH